MTSPQGRSTSHAVDLSQKSTDPLRSEERTTINAVGLGGVEDFYTQSSERVSTSDGRVVLTDYTPDPRFGADAAYPSKTTYTNGSKSYYTQTSRSVLPSSLTNPFALTSETDTVTINGAGTPTATRVFTAATSTATYTSFENRQVQVTFDARDRVSQVQLVGNVPGQSAALNPLTIDYDDVTGHGRVADIKQTTSRQTTYTYDATTGYLSNVAPTGTGSISIPASQRDYAGRAKEVDLSWSRVVTSAFDTNGNLTSLQVPRLNTHGFTPSVVDLLGKYAPPAVGGLLVKDTGYTYDVDGLVLTEDQPNTTVEYGYDGAARLTSTTFWAYPGQITNNVTYYAAGDNTTGHTPGLVQQITGGPVSPDVTLTYTYDGTMMTGETFALASPSATHTVNRTYDSRMRLSTRDIDGTTANRYTYSYDNDSVVSSVANSSYTYAICRASNGMIASSTIGSGATCASHGSYVETFTYDLYGALLTDVITYGGLPRFNLTLTRDTAGRVHSRALAFNGGAACTRTFTYDDTQTTTFLSSSVDSCSGTQNYGYDKDGNGSWTYDQQDRLSTDGTWTWAYTANGDVATQQSGGTTFTYAYDPLGNLRHFGGPSYGIIYDYKIDGRNRRIFRAKNGSSGNASGWLYDGDRIIGEMASAGSLASHFAYVTHPNVPDLTTRYEAGIWNTYRIISDDVGTVRAVMDLSTGTLVEDNTKYTYSDDYGALTQDNGNFKQPFGFAGGLVDYYPGITRFGARDFSGWQHRWMTKDPIRFGGGLNVYAYCNDDPVNCVDSTGLDPGDPYTTPTLAAVAALRQYGSIAQANDVEAAGWITQLPSGAYSYTYPLFSRPADPNNDADPDNWRYKSLAERYLCPAGQTPVSKYHSHPRLPYAVDGFTDTDQQSMRNVLMAFIAGNTFAIGWRDYMLNPKGDMRILNMTGGYFDFGKILY